MQNIALNLSSEHDWESPLEKSPLFQNVHVCCQTASALTELLNTFAAVFLTFVSAALNFVLSALSFAHQ